MDVEKYTSNGNGKKMVTYKLPLNSSSDTPTQPSPSKSYTENAENVKQYIINNGKTSSAGLKYIDSPLNSDTIIDFITYMPDIDALVFCQGTQMDYFKNYVYIFYSIADTKVTQVRYSHTYSPFDYHYEAETDMNISTYTAETALSFSATTGNPYLYQTEAEFQELCNKDTRMAMLGTQAILLSTFDMTLKDIGFISYK